MARPSVPSSIAARIFCEAGQKRRWNSTPSWTPASSHAATMRSADSSFVAMGFSQRAWTPAAAAFRTTSSCVGCGVQTETMSRSRVRSSSTVVTALGTAHASAAASARSGSTSQTPTIWTFSRARKAARWLREMAPQPAIPTRKVRGAAADEVMGYPTFEALVLFRVVWLGGRWAPPSLRWLAPRLSQFLEGNVVGFAGRDDGDSRGHQAKAW